jgi:hypothetical protein
MDEGFFELGSYDENGVEVKHYVYEEYHLWVWVKDLTQVTRFDFQYKDRCVAYSDGAFTRGSFNHIMPMFFIIELKFNCDEALRQQLLAIKAALIPLESEAGQQGAAAGEDRRWQGELGKGAL